jgi:hypothetical protein
LHSPFAADEDEVAPSLFVVAGGRLDEPGELPAWMQPLASDGDGDTTGRLTNAA